MSKSWAGLRKRFGRAEEGAEFEDEVTMPRAATLPPIAPPPPAPPIAQAMQQPLEATLAPQPPQAQQVQPQAEPATARPNNFLDTVGQKNELIRVRFANLVDRLEEIRSLRDDFVALSEPVFDLITS